MRLKISIYAIFYFYITGENEFQKFYGDFMAYHGHVLHGFSTHIQTAASNLVTLGLEKSRNEGKNLYSLFSCIFHVNNIEVLSRNIFFFSIKNKHEAVYQAFSTLFKKWFCLCLNKSLVVV